MPVAAVNGQQINYVDTGGDLPAIIWSHGFLMDHTMFDPQIKQLRDRYRCISWDERGFGATPATAPFTYWDSAADALALLDHLGVDQAIFAGMSQGGFISLRAALASPERVRALILIDTQAGQEDPAAVDGYKAMMTHWLSDEPLGDVGNFVAGLILGTEDLTARWMPRWEATRETYTEHVGNALLSRDDITDRLNEITAPALVIHAEADAAIPLELGQLLAHKLPAATLTVISGGTHAPNLTNPAETNSAIEAFLERSVAS